MWAKPNLGPVLIKIQTSTTKQKLENRCKYVLLIIIFNDRFINFSHSCSLDNPVHYFKVLPVKSWLNWMNEINVLRCTLYISSIRIQIYELAITCILLKEFFLGKGRGSVLKKRTEWSSFMVKIVINVKLKLIMRSSVPKAPVGQRSCAGWCLRWLRCN